MSEKTEQSATTIPGLAMSALDTGKNAISAAAHTAKTGARLAAGTFFAGCNLLLDLGVEALRRLPLEGRGETGAENSATNLPVVPPMGWWSAGAEGPAAGDAALRDAILNLREMVQVVGHHGRIAVARGGNATIGPKRGDEGALPLLAYVPALDPAQLGDVTFKRVHGLKYAYVAGAMANGIGSVEIVEAMSRAGCLGFFGAAGLAIEKVATAIDRIQKNLGESSYGFNLIHSPNEPALEAAVVDLYLRRNVRLVDASAYLDLTLPLVRYRVSGIHRGSDGRINCANRVIAKVSRAEVARKFFAPPPQEMLDALVKSGDITTEQSELAKTVPVSTDMTVEADSGGHTDNRPLVTLLPGMIALRDEMQKKHGYAEPLRVGAAGGISTPASVAAALGMGAAFVMTGSVNQACVEAGTSQAVREMLAQASQADVMMAPAADMFEMGVKVQVLKWGTMFGVRARKLYDHYRAYKRLEDIPPKERAVLERDFFKCTLDEAWAETQRFFETRDPRQNARAEKDPKHKMALVFRSYLGRSSDWANKGEASRKPDYQIWCGPAMGAFNDWVRSTFLEPAAARDVVTVAMNLMTGAAVLMRVQWLRAQGIEIPTEVGEFRPMPLAEISAIISPS